MTVVRITIFPCQERLRRSHSAALVHELKLRHPQCLLSHQGVCIAGDSVRFAPTLPLFIYIQSTRPLVLP